MGFIFTEFFWGILLIVFGVAVVIKVLFNINIPVFRMILAFILIYIGIRILMGGFNWTEPKNTVLFNDTQIKITNPDNNYNVIFGRGEFDLAEVALNKGVTKIEINTIFGAGFIKINPVTPMIITVNSAFANAKMPDGNEIQFGKYNYKTSSYQEGQDYLVVDVNTVFGSLEIENK